MDIIMCVHKKNETIFLLVYNLIFLYTLSSYESYMVFIGKSLVLSVVLYLNEEFFQLFVGLCETSFAKLE